MERSTSEDEPGVAPRSTPEQQGAADSEFVELEDALMDKARNIAEGNVEPRHSTRQTKALERYSTALHYLLLTDNVRPSVMRKFYR